MKYPKLNYNPFRESNTRIEGDTLIYQAIPKYKNNETYVEIWIKYDNKELIAFVDGKYSNSLGHFKRGPFRLNADACRKICEFFKTNVECYDDEELMENIPKMKFSDLEKFAQYQKENFNED